MTPARAPTGVEKNTMIADRMRRFWDAMRAADAETPEFGPGAHVPAAIHAALQFAASLVVATCSPGVDPGIAADAMAGAALDAMASELRRLDAERH